MYLDQRFSNQKGIGLVAAIFLIVVVASLVVAITRMVRTSADAFSMDVVSQRAFSSAQVGTEMALNRVFAPEGIGTCAIWTWTLDDIGLKSCQSMVSCDTQVVAGVQYYTIESHGRCSVAGVVAERTLLVRASP